MRQTRSASLSARARLQTSSSIRDLLEVARRPGVVSLAGGIPHESLLPTPTVMSDALRSVMRGPGGRALQYGPTRGEPALIDAIAGMTGAAPERVLVTAGAQQALDLLADVLVDPGAAVIVPDPMYLGAAAAARRRGAELVPAPTAGPGLSALLDRFSERQGEGAAGAIESARPAPAFAYGMPTFGNPSSEGWADQDASERSRLLAGAGVLDVRDDPYHELAFRPVHGRRPWNRPERPDNTATCGSFSKCLAPGLRVGWIEGPEWCVEAMEVAKQTADLHTGTLDQLLVAELLAHPWFDEALAARRTWLAERHDTLIGSLSAAFGDRVSVEPASGGMFLWARFPECDMAARLTAAIAAGVAYVPGPEFAVEAELAEWARLSFASCQPDEIERGVSRLAQVLGRA